MTASELKTETHDRSQSPIDTRKIHGVAARLRWVAELWVIEIDHPQTTTQTSTFLPLGYATRPEAEKAANDVRIGCGLRPGQYGGVPVSIETGLRATN